MSESQEVKQLSETVTALTRSLEQSQKHTRRLERFFSIAIFAVFSVVLTVAISGSNLISNAHADNSQKMEQMLEQLMPAIMDAATLISRLKQDSDLARVAILKTRNIPVNAKTLESTDASIDSSIAKEIHFINESLVRMNYSMMLMARSMDTTMGRFGEWMP